MLNCYQYFPIAMINLKNDAQFNISLYRGKDSFWYPCLVYDDCHYLLPLQQTLQWGSNGWLLVQHFRCIRVVNFFMTESLTWKTCRRLGHSRHFNLFYCGWKIIHNHSSRSKLCNAYMTEPVNPWILHKGSSKAKAHRLLSVISLIF